jgi:hypothetical protein
MRTVIKIIIIFLVISAFSTVLFNNTNIVFGSIDFFTKHGWIFLISIALFPRLTLLVSGVLFHSVEFGGLLWWLGFFFAPRILIATLATLAYWNTNQLLVIFAWLIALGGESSEKMVIRRKMRSAPQKLNDYEGTTIEAEFKIKD